jgi:hypothetical protein
MNVMIAGLCRRGNLGVCIVHGFMMPGATVVLIPGAPGCIRLYPLVNVYIAAIAIENGP